MKKKTNPIKKYVKANRKGSRDAELENQTGWVSKHKIHTPKTVYKRKKRHETEE
ncbi:MAG TPA: hypothetical protein VK172_01390 [Lentimicrobium sp.]|nr:hypothetical protein [Lentimicrobium sp.]